MSEAISVLLFNYFTSKEIEIDVNEWKGRQQRSEWMNARLTSKSKQKQKQ